MDEYQILEAVVDTIVEECQSLVALQLNPVYARAITNMYRAEIDGIVSECGFRDTDDYMNFLMFKEEQQRKFAAAAN